MRGGGSAALERILEDSLAPPKDILPRLSAFGVALRLAMSDSVSTARVGIESGDEGVGPTTTVERRPIAFELEPAGVVARVCLLSTFVLTLIAPCDLSVFDFLRVIESTVDGGDGGIWTGVRDEKRSRSAMMLFSCATVS